MKNIVVMGLGNLLYGDEGFGVHAVGQLHKGWNFPDHVQIIDGGTQGHTLLTFVEEADLLLLLDAVDFGRTPGSLSVRMNKGVPAYLTAQKISPHQNSFSEVLALAQLKDTLPEELVLIGVHPVSMDMGAPLSPLVEAQLPSVLTMALDHLARWGVTVQARDTTTHLYHPELTCLI